MFAVAALLAGMAAASAYAATSVSLKASFSTKTPDKGAVINGVFAFTGNDYFGSPAPVTTVVLVLPPGVTGNRSGFPTCTEAVLAADGVSGCPEGSLAGPRGSARLYVEFGGERIEEQASVQGVFGAGEEIDFYLEGNSPAAIGVVMPGVYVDHELLEVDIPLTTTVPGAPYTSMKYLDLRLGATRKHGRSKVSSVVTPNPNTCTAGEFTWQASAAFFEQPTQHASYESACTT